MAAYMRSVKCLVAIERQGFATNGQGVVVESRRYVRGLRRKPVRVLFPDSEQDKVVKTTPQSQPVVHNFKNKKDVKHEAPLRRHAESAFVKARSHVTSSINDAHVTDRKEETDGLRFERAFPGDKRLGRVVSAARSRTFREHQGKILLEGRRLICDALDAGAKPQMVFFSTVDRLRELPVDKLKRATLIKVKFEDIKIWSNLVAPQGVIAIFSRPDPLRMDFPNRGHSMPLSLICDNIRDPGNLGTMLRCAAAAGCHNVLLTKGCVDAWEPKVLRAAMGAHFRLPIFPSLSWDDIESHLPKPVTVHVADSSCDAEISEEVKDLQVNMSDKPSKAGDYGWVSTKPNHRNMRYEEYHSDSDSDSNSDSDSDGEYEALQLPRVGRKPYHQSWAQSPTALVIGGETQGLSLEAVQLAEKTDGCRLFIPIVPAVDSLNSAMAASILLFEGRKQLLKLMQTPGRKWKSG